MTMWVPRRIFEATTEELSQATRRAAMLTGQMAGMETEVRDLRAQLLDAHRLIKDLALRPATEPIIVPPPPAIDLAAVLEAVAAMFAPTVTPTITDGDARQAQIWAANNDPTAGAGRGQWFPDVEFDDYLQRQGDVWPTTGGWVAGNAGVATSPPANGMSSPRHAVDKMGTLTRLDGTPMFQSGLGSDPPVGGTE